MQTDFVKADMMASASDERWTAWVAKGVEHDRKNKRVMAIAAAVAAGAALPLVIFLLR